MAILKRVGCMVAAAIVLGGCALPMPVKVASWAIDGISYIATKKTVTDHGVSMALGQDCALLRAVTDKGKVCVDDASSGTVVAKAKKPLDQRKKGSSKPVADEVLMAARPDLPNSPIARPEADPAEDIAAELARFETAAGGGEANAKPEKGSVAPDETPHRMEIKEFMLPEDAGLLSLWQGEKAGDSSLMASREAPLVKPEKKKAVELARFDAPQKAAERAVQDASVLPEGLEIIARWEDMKTDPAGEELLAESDETEELASTPVEPQKARLPQEARGRTAIQARVHIRSDTRSDGRSGDSDLGIGGWLPQSGPLERGGTGFDRENFRVRAAMAVDGLFASRANLPVSTSLRAGKREGTRTIFNPNWHHIRAGPLIGWDQVLFLGHHWTGAAPPSGDASGHLAYLRMETGPPNSYH